MYSDFQNSLNVNKQYLKLNLVMHSTFAPQCASSPPTLHPPSELLQSFSALTWCGLVVYCRVGAGSVATWFNDNSSGDCSDNLRAIPADCGEPVLLFSATPH